MGRGSTQEPPCRPFEDFNFLHCWRNLDFFGYLQLVLLYQNLPQSKDVEHILEQSVYMIADNIVADSYLLANLRRDIADDIIAGLFILFDVDSEPDDHSEVLLLFVGCIVNFIVSYLICMFQDSVPAGSYNDPFLSSVISMVAPTWCHGAI